MYRTTKTKLYASFEGVREIKKVVKMIKILNSSRNENKLYIFFKKDGTQ